MLAREFSSPPPFLSGPNDSTVADRIRRARLWALGRGLHRARRLIWGLALWRSGPSQPFEQRAAHDPILVVPREEAQFLGELRDSLAIGGPAEGIGHVGAPVTALRTVGVE